MPISFWGGREPRPGQRWEYYAYGPDLPPLPSVGRLSEPERQAQRRKLVWIASVEAVVLAVTVVTVGAVTRNPAAVFVAVLVVPCLVLIAALISGAVLEVRRAADRSVPAEPAGGGAAADDRPDGEGHPVVERR